MYAKPKRRLPAFPSTPRMTRPPRRLVARMARRSDQEAFCIIQRFNDEEEGSYLGFVAYWPPQWQWSTISLEKMPTISLGAATREQIITGTQEPNGSWEINKLLKLPKGIVPATYRTNPEIPATVLKPNYVPLESDHIPPEKYEKEIRTRLEDAHDLLRISI